MMEELLEKYPHILSVCIAIIVIYAIPAWIITYHIIKIHHKLNKSLESK